MPTATRTPRFLQLRDITEILNVSNSQAYALVRSGELPAIKVGGRGQWRVETTELESYIQRSYAETRSFIESHPFGADVNEELEDVAARDQVDQVEADLKAAGGRHARGLRAG